MSENYTPHLLTECPGSFPNTHEVDGWPNARMQFAKRMKELVPKMIASTEKGVTRRFDAKTGEWGARSYEGAQCVQDMLDAVATGDTEPALGVRLVNVLNSPPELMTAVTNRSVVEFAAEIDDTVLAPELASAAFHILCEEEQRVILRQAVQNSLFILMTEQSTAEDNEQLNLEVEACSGIREKMRPQKQHRNNRIKIGNEEFSVPFPAILQTSKP